MTVCTASIFVWRYGPEDLGTAIVAASDKMLTDEGLGIEYPGLKGKWAAFDKRLLVLVAGAMVIHSEVIRRLSTELKDVETLTTFDLAENVAKEIREYRTQEAVRTYLSPLGLDQDLFLAGQRTMDSNLVLELSNQMQQYAIEAEALVMGCDKEANLYRIDRYGIITNNNDIGFASIGSGRNTFQRPFHA